MNWFSIAMKISQRVLAWVFTALADGKVTKEEWQQLARVILDSVEDAGVEVELDVDPRKLS